MLKPQQPENPIAGLCKPVTSRRLAQLSFYVLKCQSRRPSSVAVLSLNMTENFPVPASVSPNSKKNRCSEIGADPSKRYNCESSSLKAHAKNRGRNWDKQEIGITLKGSQRQVPHITAVLSLLTVLSVRTLLQARCTYPTEGTRDLKTSWDTGTETCVHQTTKYSATILDHRGGRGNMLPFLPLRDTICRCRNQHPPHELPRDLSWNTFCSKEPSLSSECCFQPRS